MLSDGTTARVRPIVPDDGDGIRAFHDRQSRESIYFRFFSPRPRLSDADVVHMTTVDGFRRMAFVAERDGELLGVARYDRYGDRPVAEVAFFTDDQFHGRGIATIMLEYLAAHARDVGIATFEAHVLPSNRRMVSVFKQAGFQVSSEFADGVILVTLGIEPTEDAAAAIEARARAAERQAVARLLEPRSVAVIGAGRDPGGMGHRIVRNLLRRPFRGPVYPVHPEARAIAGLRAYPSVRDIPDDVDLAVIVVPAAEVAAVVEDCGRAHVDAAVVISAGFAEAGPDGAELEDAVLVAARRFGVRVLGPNCLGVINTDPEVDLHATFAEIDPLPGGVGLLSQSGTLGAVILDRARAKGLGISSFVAVGNKSDLSGNDILQYWRDDDRTDVVLLYLESFGNPRRFSSNVRQVAATKPVFAVRSGAVLESGGGGDDGGLDDTTVDALLRQTGVVRVPTINALLDAAVVASRQPVPAGPRIAIVGNSGGSASMAADACADAGLELASLADDTVAALGELRLTGRQGVNPVDLRYDATAQDYRAALDAVAVDDGVDCVLFVHAPYAADDVDHIAAMLDEVVAAHPETTLVAAVYGPHPATTRGGVPIFHFPDDAGWALGRVARYGSWLTSQERGDVQVIEDPAALVAQARTLLGPAARRRLDPDEVAAFLHDGGVDAIPVAVVRDAASLRVVVDETPFDGVPLAVKADRHQPGASTRKTGVALDLHDADAVVAAAEAMADTLGDAAWPMLVQPMVEPGTDVRISVDVHPLVGPVIQVGPGGGAARYAAGQRQVLPISDRTAAELVDDAGFGELLSEQARAKLISLVRRIGAVVDAVPEIAELRCDPVIVRDDGAEVIEASITLETVPTDDRPIVRRLA